MRRTRMLIGYARVSTEDQRLDLQHDALTQAGCERVFVDVASGKLSDRSGLTKALDFVRNGDTLVVWKLDRLGRSLRHLIDTVSALEARGIGFRSMQESIDTTTSGGKLVFHVFGALAEFERDLVRERTNAGLAAARARGRRGGRPTILDATRTALARSLCAERGVGVGEVATAFGVSRSTLYRHLRLAVTGERATAESSVMTPTPVEAQRECDARLLAKNDYF